MEGADEGPEKKKKPHEHFAMPRANQSLGLVLIFQGERRKERPRKKGRE